METNSTDIGSYAGALGFGIIGIILLIFGIILIVMWTLFPIFVYVRLGRIATNSANILYEIRKIQGTADAVQTNTGSTEYNTRRIADAMQPQPPEQQA